MNKWIILGATLLITLIFAYTVPITMKNPSRNNLLVSGVLFVISIMGLLAFYFTTKSKTKKEDDYIKTLTPVE